MKRVINLEIFRLLEHWAPKHLAYDWDNIGLQLGSNDDHVTRIMVSLDVLESVVDEAISKDVDLIISHHPLIFKPLKQIDFGSPKGKTIQKLIKHNIAVYTAHTNLDIADGGVNDLLAQQLGLNIQGSIVDVYKESLYKVIVYVPNSHTEEIQDAFHRGGAGQIGNYSHCTFQTFGKGTFKPLEGSDPYSGKKNELSRVDEVKMESIVPECNLSTVIKEIKKSHPYDEVAYDIYLLGNQGKTYGLGRIGILKSELSLKQLCEKVKNKFSLSHLKITGSLDKRVKNVAILGGSGEKYILDALNRGADVLITGDMTFHTAQEALDLGLAVIDAGHYIEQIMKEATKIYLDKTINNSEIEVICSTKNTDPFQYI